ncbi:MAG: TetR/AcrR family transcriptional regulator [Aquificae bacterium]|nr:TetR/AcrR family transcriptional regulator [Aquificota bacterium]
MSQSVNTKDRLIWSAVKVFSEKGYFNAKISDIVKEAGLAQGTFYLYFSSKEDIFFQIIELIIEQIQEVIDRYKHQKHKEDIKQVIHSFSKEMFFLFNQYREVAYIYFFQLLCMQEKFKELYISTYEKFIQFYIELLSEYRDREILAGMIVSFAEKLFKLDILIKHKNVETVISEFNEGVEILLKGAVES